jgi:hypothetical protein
MLVEKHASQPGMACRMLDLPSSSYYYCTQAKVEDDLKNPIQSVTGRLDLTLIETIYELVDLSLCKAPCGLLEGEGIFLVSFL